MQDKSEKKPKFIITIIIECAWTCLNKEDFEYALSHKYLKILNMAKFWIWFSSQ